VAQGMLPARTFTSTARLYSDSSTAALRQAVEFFYVTVLYCAVQSSIGWTVLWTAALALQPGMQVRICPIGAHTCRWTYYSIRVCNLGRGIAGVAQTIYTPQVSGCW
jgi:hypothetical protein